MPEALAGGILKTVVIAIVGGVVATGFAFWANSTASADTSSSFQNARVAFEKAVSDSDVVIGENTNRIGLLKNVAGDKCEVQTWQGGERDGKISLRVDTDTVPGTCSPATALLKADSTPHSMEYAFDIATPKFEYANLGARAVTFDSEATPTLASGTRPSTVKVADWDDMRPYKVSMSLHALDKDNAKAAQSSVATGYTDVVNITEAGSALKYIPATDASPIPGPLRVTGVDRSTVAGTTIASAREGIRVTLVGGVCTSGNTKVNVSYSQQSPAAAPPVNTVVDKVLTGDEITVHLNPVANGSSGKVEVAASCIEGGAVVKDSVGYGQPVPATVLTVKQNATGPHVHDLSWVAVSSLPTEFTITWQNAGAKRTASTAALSYTATNAVGSTLGATTTYSIVARVDQVQSDPATASITNPVPAPAASKIVAGQAGATWAAVTCVPGSTAQYMARHYQQVGTSTTVTKSGSSSWGTGLSLSGVTTPAYGRTVYEVLARCVSSATGAVSNTALSAPDAFYVPEAYTVAVARSASTGAVYGGLREGAQVTYSGGRCWNGSRSSYTTVWNPAKPTGQTAVTIKTAAVTTGSVVQQVGNVRNGAQGSFSSQVTCDQPRTATSSKTTAFTQSLPAPQLTVTQGSTALQHVAKWTTVSSLPTSFQIRKTAASGSENALPGATTALTQTLSYSAGVPYGNKMNYTVTATVGSVSKASTADSITTPWPATPTATGIAYTRTGGGGKFVGGKVTWGYAGSCPAGTTLRGRLSENRTGQSNGTISTTVQYTTPWAVGKNTHDWWPSYALEGYAYGVGVNAECISNPTGFVSPISSTQSANWVTAMQRPPAPVWDAYNWHDWVRGTNRTYSTCYYGGCPSMTIDYKYTCSPGAALGYSNFTSTDWNPHSYNHPFGWQDNWLLPSGVRNVTYSNPIYNCKTPWNTSALSPYGASKIVSVYSNGWW